MFYFFKKNLKQIQHWKYKRDILSLSDSNGTRNHNHLPRNWTLNHLAKLATYIFYFIWAYRFLKFSVWMA